MKTQIFMFRYKRLISTRKCTIVAEIVCLLKKIYKGDVPLGALFKVKTLAVLFPQQILRNLRWPNTVFAHAFADVIQHVHEDHAVNRAIILLTQHPHYLCYFSL